MIQRGLPWKDNSSGELEPTWTELPNISVVRDLAAQHLPQTFTDIAVEFFAEGAFNKLYSICSPHHLQHYIMHITLPVEPFFFKTESECATLAYIRSYTSIPVPTVIPYSSSENPLGFEWMLFEKIEGVPLSDVWEKMDFDSKVRLTLDISNLLQQQHDLEFS